jgi:hypothetical protein
MCVVVVILGSGPLSLSHYLRTHWKSFRRAPAPAPAPAEAPTP